MMYRLLAGYVAWLLNRITGLLITLYLILHIWVVHHLAHGPQSYARVMEFLSSKLFIFFELGLIGVVLFHMMNGIRIVLVDFWGGATYQKPIFWALMGIGLILYLLCAWELAGLFLGLAAAPTHAAL
jgi:succinate dehydrogenase / fumarate reductase cytochrome b subunit